MRYLALGDSYTIGEGVTASERWPVQLAARLRDRGKALEAPEILARTGWTTDELASALSPHSPRGPYALASLLIGVNDQYRGSDPNTYRAAYAALLARVIGLAGGEAKRVIALSIPDWGVSPFASGRDRERIASEIDRFNAINREEAGSLGARYVDITLLSREAVPSGGTPFAADGLHPSGIAYAAWAEAALPAALAALEELPGRPNA